MAADRHLENLASQRDRQVQVGLILTALWLGAGVLYVAVSMGWTAFLRLLRSAAGCDPEGMIVDALHGNAQGRLYRLMCTLRDSPPAGVPVAG
jgi:hypothetical protein